MTLGEALEWGESKLRQGPHPERARRDAETLLLHHIGRERAWLLGHLEDEFAGCRALGFAALIERRQRGEPVQYVLGETEFYGLPFRVTPDVLIPRPETEHLVEKVLELASTLKEPRIVDVGTGSGAIAVALAYHLPHASITAIDISPASLALARENAERNGVAARLCFLAGDLLGPVGAQRFDLVVSNPPYVSLEERDSLAVEVREFEPALALFAGEDGLLVYRRLFAQAHASLVRGGVVAVEIGCGQAQAVAEMVQAAGFGEVEFAPDLQGIARVATARRP